MKTVINNAATESFEFIKRAIYDFDVLVIGLLIPFLFMIGINTNYGNTASNESEISTQHKESKPQATVVVSMPSSDKHS